MYLNQPLQIGVSVEIGSESAHYLSNVLRLREGSLFRAFNGNDNEFGCEYLLELCRSKNVKRMKNIDQVHANVLSQIRNSESNTQLPVTLYFAPIRSKKVKLLLEKATELGVEKMAVVQTELTQGGNDFLDSESLLRVIVDAVEQSERISLPSLSVEPVSLVELLDHWQRLKDNGDEVRLLVCKERMDQSGGMPLLSALLQTPQLLISEGKHLRERSTPFGLVVGPEGGWTTAESDLFRERSVVQTVSLGDSVLRSETACITALSLFSGAVDHVRWKQSVEVQTEQTK